MCGIAGIVNRNRRSFDYSTFCTLGIVNDSRGGDSCGVFIDGNYDYGVGETKFFQQFFLENPLINETEEANVAFLHCRKASVGKISIETAQPVIIHNSKGEVDYVLMHNGTIHNYKELANKYIPNIDITGMTDSQVMAHIFYYTGYDSLNEYNGGAVFAIADYRTKGEPKILLFKGASKKTKYSKEIEEERPLFYCIDKVNKELVFSSIGIYLVSLRKQCTAYILRPNYLCEFTGTTLRIVKEYSRSEAFQDKETKTYYIRDLDDYYGYYGYSKYIATSLTDNLYRTEGKLLDGKYIFTRYGKIEEKHTKAYNTFEAYFFKGVALKSQACYRFLNVLQKESRLSDKDFCKKFANVIRFLSIDGVYYDEEEGKWYKATSPTCRVLHTGVVHPITNTSCLNIVAGSKTTTTYITDYDYIEKTLNVKVDINFKTVKSECKSLMK